MRRRKKTKSISDEYNEKTLKRMGYILKNNKWTLKSTKKTDGDNASKENTPFGSSSRQKRANKTLIHEFKGNNMEIGGFMT